MLDTAIKIYMFAPLTRPVSLNGPLQVEIAIWQVPDVRTKGEQWYNPTAILINPSGEYMFDLGHEKEMKE
jgi:hypothetical protein